MSASFDPTIFRTRRDKLLAQLGNGVAVIPTAPERVRNADNHFPFRPDSDFWYLTGFPEPEAVLVLCADGQGVQRQWLFCRIKDAERETWDGFRYGPAAAAETFGMDGAFPIEDLDRLLPILLRGRDSLYFPMALADGWPSRWLAWWQNAGGQERYGHFMPSATRDLRPLLDHMRIIKDRYEIDRMQTAADIASSAHLRAMQVVRPGMFEYEMEAEFLHEFRRRDASGPLLWQHRGGRQERLLSALW